ncbi:3'-5' exonuclease [Aeromonas enteropelogenes]|uniref:3'-5' exonuclease n=1 Tax=Aeromonas enteropelogenes TaxID=29489 RepID=UPI003F7425C8
MKHVMLDLETMGNGPRAAIVTIGAVFFDPMTGELGAEFEAHIHLSDSARFGEMDPDTVLWWLRQSDDARAALKPSAKHQQLNDALWGLYKWMVNGSEGNDGNLNVWGNGASFDNVILRNACQQTRVAPAWSYWKDRDVRTVVDMGRELLGFDPKKDMPFDGVAHRALDDAKHQARYVSAIYQRLQAAINGYGMVGGAE